ncbi:hypothetical protein H6H00_15445 [Pseudonocardia petroleophila]|uniref:Uncharacterized protein n=1 Tax=Pseudonocardia petroleophila TaxID=37331 RepID=A0A7G7MS67_9PSEU|nr:hypothetical protein H6H00_15445 [Pseudonocardia petroleophila]
MRPIGGPAAVVAGLHRWIDDHDPHVQAAIWLLLAHEVWPRRADFRQACVHHSPDGGWWIDFRAARIAFDNGAFDTAASTELAVLDLAITLGTDRFRFRAMGPGNARAVATAVAHAVGTDR